MAATSTVEFKLLFEDDTTQTFSLGPMDLMDASDIASTKSKIKNFINNEFTSDTALMMSSKYGNKWAGFSSVKVLNVQRNVIF